jgi:hypothetical protein
MWPFNKKGLDMSVFFNTINLRQVTVHFTIVKECVMELSFCSCIPAEAAQPVAGSSPLAIVGAGRFLSCIL